MKKKFYAILLTALMLFSVGCGAAMATDSKVKWTVLPRDGAGGDVALEFYTSSDVIYGKTKVTSADWTNHRFIEITSEVSSKDDIYLKATPETMDGLTFKTSKDVSGDTTIVFGWLEGTLTTDVTEDTTRGFTVTATRGSTSTESLTASPADLSFTLAVNPTIKTETPDPIVWGQSWSFKPSLSGVKEKYYVSADWTLLPSGDTYLSEDVLSSDAIQFDSKTGTLSGTWKPAYCSTDITSPDWNSPDVKLPDIEKRKIKLKVTRGSGDRAVSDDEVFELTFKAVAPAIMSTDTEITNALKAIDSNKGFMWSKYIPVGTGVSITAEGPGIISWDVNGYSVISSTSPDANVVSDDSLGLVYDAKQVGYTSTLRIYGYPTTTVKNMAFPITASNPAGSKTVTATLSIGSDQFSVTVVSTSADLPSGNVRVGESVGTVILEAQPGPVTWEASKNLPAGLTLTPIANGKRALLTGTFSTPRTVEDGITYKITATNPVLASDDVLSADIKVWGKPVISNKYAFAAKNTITTKKEYKWELTATNFPNSQDWEVEIDGLKESTTHKWNVKDGTSNISLDIVSEDGGYKAKLTGSIDRVPEDGVFTVKVTAENYYGKSDTETFVVNVDGVAPVMTAQSFVLNTSKTGDAKVDRGDAPLKMTATITDSKTLAAFGLSDPITLTDKADVYTGLSFVVSSDDGKATFKYEVPSKGDVAYTQLPVRVTAENTADSSLKPASVTHRITVTGQSPSFTNSNDISGTYCDILKDSADVPSAVTLTVPAGKALPVKDANNRIVFKINGANPLVTTIKPNKETNGILAATEENGTLLTFTGTPTATKKDVTTKFTVTTTNPLTNESKKIVVTVVAKPTPVIDTSKTLDKEVLVGKKVKITPKATVTTTGMKWAVSKISGGNANGGGAVTNEKTLYDQYGLEFDTTKGTISGTATHPTGKDNPIEVEFRATDSTGTISSDVATAKITILGAKPKLLTKKMNLVVGTPLTTTAGGTGVLETNLDDANTGESSGLHIANVQIEATTPLPDGISVLDNTNNAPTLSGTPSKAMKKVATEFQLKNFDTVGKGKITFMVADVAPVVNNNQADTASINVGESKTVNLAVTNASNADLKYKWKITTKPTTSGISAKVKGNGKYATLTLKVNKKVTAPATDTVVVTVTDPLTKSTGTGTVNITVTSPTSTNDSPLEAGETKAETKAEAKDMAANEKEVKDVALGEGEVHMGAGRTADKLTAAQRKAIEDKGYVIAAVLPEIEVTASGQYDFEVDLDEEVKTGAELVWFAFSTKPTTDDEIVDFADEKGEETKVVPESHVVIVAPWLNAEAKYAPVIAVKADAKDADATTAEGVKEAAEAKTEE